MEDTPTIAAVRGFLALLNDGAAPSGRELARALDQLAMAYHEAPDGDPAEEDRESPTHGFENYKERYAKLGKRFPDYGYYAVADPMKPITQESLVGDAIDDLADIAGDLEEVVWRFENLGADDAHWHFRFLFEIHWGMHLRELSLYLHANWLRASDED
ncbi:MAG TPA: DUF5063 domain-containing protein [Sphingomicrobium sp.]|nr:DUF5063 domain-containing protein [Sphingomicrobium sp.]